MVAKILKGEICMPYLVMGIIIVIAVLFFKSATGKGILGELDIKIVIGGNNEKKGKYVINNITFFDGKKSVQIDHILIDQNGIHVIETKNYAGRIYGRETDDEWTQVLAYGKVKNKFYNPIKQNAGLIYALKQVLNLDYDYYSYVVFTKKAELKISSVNTLVIPSYLLRKAINKRNSERLLKLEEIVFIYNKLLEMKKGNTITKREHVRSINERIKKRNKASK